MGGASTAMKKYVLTLEKTIKIDVDEHPR